MISVSQTFSQIVNLEILYLVKKWLKLFGIFITFVPLSILITRKFENFLKNN